MGDDFGVGFGDEFMALGGEFTLQFQVILNDAVVDDDDAAGAIPMRVGVLFRGASMCGPAGVADAVCALDGMLAQNLFEIAELARSAANLKRGSGWTADGDARRVVAAIFQTPQPLDDDRDYLLGTDITDDSAHTEILCDTPGKST